MDNNDSESSKAPKVYDGQITMFIHHVSSRFYLGCEINIELIAKTASNVELSSCRTYVRLSLKEPFTKARIYRSGKVVLMGSKGLTVCKIGARKVARIVQKSHPKANFHQFRVFNGLVTTKMPFEINLVKFYELCRATIPITYETEQSSAAFCRINGITFKVHTSGSVSLTGAPVKQFPKEMEKLYPFIYEAKAIPPPALKSFRQPSQYQIMTSSPRTLVPNTYKPNNGSLANTCTHVNNNNFANNSRPTNNSYLVNNRPINNVPNNTRPLNNGYVANNSRLNNNIINNNAAFPNNSNVQSPKNYIIMKPPTCKHNSPNVASHNFRDVNNTAMLNRMRMQNNLGQSSSSVGYGVQNPRPNFYNPSNHNTAEQTPKKKPTIISLVKN